MDVCVSTHKVACTLKKRQLPTQEKSKVFAYLSTSAFQMLLWLNMEITMILTSNLYHWLNFFHQSLQHLTRSAFDEDFGSIFHHGLHRLSPPHR